MEDIRQVKRQLRGKIRDFRRQLDAAAKSRMDSSIAQAFLTSTSYTKSDVILTYVSTNIEIDTYFIIDTALSDGKQVACPRCIDGTREMEFYYINSTEELSPRTFGVYEPDDNPEMLFKGAERPICIVPGLAFDRWGYRLGYGKGYYDRFLSRYQGWTVGFCYSSCVEYKLPHGRFDRPVDRLITEKYIRRCDDRRPGSGIKSNRNF